MIIIISGSSHSGKTYLSQQLLEQKHYPYLSIDHLKMGLIRSKQTNLTPLSSDLDLTNYLWPIVVEIIKTAIENKQNLIVEGCYVPCDWCCYFTDDYLKEINCFFLIMSKDYIINNFDQIKNFENVIERRITFDLDINELINDNIDLFEKCKNNNLKYYLIDNDFNKIINQIIKDL